MDIIYMGTPDFAVPALEQIYKSGHNIKLVVTQEDKRKGRGKKFQYTAVKNKALELGLEVFQPKSINSEDSIDKLREMKPDVIVVAAYGQILKEEVLKLPKYKCINIHASLLPKYRGAAPINWAIINGEEKTGITIMEMEKGLDTGDMFLKDDLLIGENDDSQTIHDKLSLMGGELIVKVLDKLKDNDLVAEKQDDSLATYAEKIYKETGIINWNNDANDIKNLVRGLKPWPKAYTVYENEIIKIDDIEVMNEESTEEPGKVLSVSESGIKVSTKNNVINIKTIQFPGKKMMKVSDYIRGNDFKTDILLG